MSSKNYARVGNIAPTIKKISKLIAMVEETSCFADVIKVCVNYDLWSLVDEEALALAYNKNGYEGARELVLNVLYTA